MYLVGLDLGSKLVYSRITGSEPIPVQTSRLRLTCPTSVMLPE